MGSFRQEFARIDRMRSMRAMHDAVAAIPSPKREAIIVYAAGMSRFQWTWSSIAKANGVDISMIPNPHHARWEHKSDLGGGHDG